MRCRDGCDCDCCRGLEAVTPRAVRNAPGQDSVRTRIGTRDGFFETMLARLSSSDAAELAQLAARTTDDPSIALLDGCATMADVLTFYQERIANEGYLRTATERRSVHELGRLIGYHARPGVSASVHLAYDIDPNATDPLMIEAGSRVQSVPGPGELPQTFETIEDIVARKEWNAILPRIDRPATHETLINGTAEQPGARVWLQGIATGLKPGDPILVEYRGAPAVYRATSVDADAMTDRTRIGLSGWLGEAIPSIFDPDPDEPAPTPQSPGSIERSREIIRRLAIPGSVPPVNALALARDPATVFAPGAEIGLAAIGTASPPLGSALAAALASAGSRDAPPLRVHALRKNALLFAATAPGMVVSVDRETGIARSQEWTDAQVIAAEDPTSIALEAPDDKLLAGSWVVLDYNAVPVKLIGRLKLPPLDRDRLLIVKAGQIRSKTARAAYGISGQTTRIGLVDPLSGAGAEWFEHDDPGPAIDVAAFTPSPGFQLVRNLDILCESEELTLAPDPITEPVCGGDQWIETDRFTPGLETGRWLVVTGKRADIPGTDAVDASELAMISGIRHDATRIDTNAGSAGGIASDGSVKPASGPNLPAERGFAPGETLRTQIRLAAPLNYCYVRGSVRFNANVAKANHGETRIELLGSGDASEARQEFVLRQPPLTFTAANEPDGIASTLRVYVGGVEWHEAEAVAVMGAQSRGFVTEGDDDADVSLTFGDGVHGARLPTGVNNVEARYRSGIGLGGNVRAGQITQLMTRQLGVRSVANPMAAAGGSYRDPIERMRVNAPLSVASLDRLVSVSDYADFSRTFAGIAKAVSARLAFGGRAGVWLTIAGNDDIAIPPASDLFQLLARALRDYSDPDLPVRILARDRLTLVLAVRIAISPDYRWDDVERRVRAVLLARYGFEPMALGASIAFSAIVAAIQAERGVDYVDIDSFGAVSTFAPDGARLAPEEVAAAFAKVVADCRANGPPGKIQALGIRADGDEVRAAQLVCVAPDLPDSLILNRIEQP